MATAYRALTYFSIGLPRPDPDATLHVQPGDLVPPSFAAVNEHVIREWVKDKTVALVDADLEELERADLAAGYVPSRR